MAHCSDPICWYCLLAVGYTRVPENLTGHRGSQLGVPLWKALTGRALPRKELGWMWAYSGLLTQKCIPRESVFN